MDRKFRYRYKKPARDRLIAALFLFLLCFAALAVRLFFIQIARHKYYSDIVKNSRTAFIDLPAKRGLVFDRNLTPLVMNVPMHSLYAIPRYMEDKNRAAKKLAGVLDADEEDILRRISTDRMFAWIARKLPDGKARQAMSLGIKGLGLVAESERSYPHGSLAAHILGFVDIDNKGLEGVEKYYDAELRGADGRKAVIVDAKRRAVGAVEGCSTPPEDGSNIVLTIDEAIQHITEKAVLSGVKKYNPKSASVVVMDPSDGGILALCNWPAFALNEYSEAAADLRRNRAITDVFEPGSSFKIVTAAAVLEEAAVSPEDEFYCENGAYKIAGRVLHDHKPHGTLKFKNIIELSSNIGTVKAAQALGEERLIKYIRSFGFGRRTGVDLPGEAEGILRDFSAWSKGSIAAVPIGQEIAVTALQLAAAISCIANDGIFMRPRVVWKLVDDDKVLIREFKPSSVRRVISKENCLKLNDILRMVIDSGTGKNALVPGYSAAGKTGTGQRIEADGSYSHTKFNSVFLGFAPLDDPRLAISVVFIEPRPRYYGGTVAAPVFSEIAAKVLRYMEVPPDRGADKGAI